MQVSIICRTSANRLAQRTQEKEGRVEGLTPIGSYVPITTQNTPPIPSVPGLWGRDKPSTASTPSRIIYKLLGYTP